MLVLQNVDSNEHNYFFLFFFKKHFIKQNFCMFRISTSQRRLYDFIYYTHEELHRIGNNIHTVQTLKKKVMCTYQILYFLSNNTTLLFPKTI